MAIFCQCALWDRETFSSSKISVSGGLRKMGIFRCIRPSWCWAIELDQQVPRTTGETRLFADQSIWHLKAWTGGKKGWGVITDLASSRVAANDIWASDGSMLSATASFTEPKTVIDAAIGSSTSSTPGLRVPGLSTSILHGELIKHQNTMIFS